MAETKATIEEQPTKAWHSYLSEDLPQSFMDSTDTAFSNLRSFQVSIPEIKQKFQSYEHAVFTHLKDGLSIGAEHPAMAAGITLAATFVFFRGPRRFLFRQTVGRFQTDETRFVRAEKNMKMLQISVDLMKKESRKLLERSTFAEKEMTSGQAELINVGKQMQRLAKSVNHVESQAADLMDLLRELPGRDALRLRAEANETLGGGGGGGGNPPSQVASSASLLKHQRTGLVKRMSKLTEAGVPVSEASVSRNRSTIIIPAGTTRDEGWAAFRNILAEINETLGLFALSNQDSEASERLVGLSDDVGAGFIATLSTPQSDIKTERPVELPTQDETSGNLGASKVIRVDQKRFFFDLGNNNRGHFLRISEFHETLGHFVEISKDKIEGMTSANVRTVDPPQR
ncbi:hypothetical protein KSS87_023610 [Heliosperma pusillum]|nr:hypothetical protein KSS87_023610 [Heliosperma pusillum]